MEDLLQQIQVNLRGHLRVQGPTMVLMGQVYQAPVEE